MKLIIDIPDEAYDILTEYQVLPENIDLEYFVIHGIPLEDAKIEIQNTILEQVYEKGAIEELEKIKAELKKTYPMNGYGIPSSRAIGKSAGYGIHIALEIIDKHISELKGSE